MGFEEQIDSLKQELTKVVLEWVDMRVQITRSRRNDSKYNFKSEFTELILAEKQNVYRQKQLVTQLNQAQNIPFPQLDPRLKEYEVGERV